MTISAIDLTHVADSIERACGEAAEFGYGEAAGMACEMLTRFPRARTAAAATRPAPSRSPSRTKQCSTQSQRSKQRQGEPAPLEAQAASGGHVKEGPRVREGCAALSAVTVASAHPASGGARIVPLPRRYTQHPRPRKGLALVLPCPAGKLAAASIGLTRRPPAS